MVERRLKERKIGGGERKTTMVPIKVDPEKESLLSQVERDFKAVLSESDGHMTPKMALLELETRYKVDIRKLISLGKEYELELGKAKKRRPRGRPKIREKKALIGHLNEKIEDAKLRIERLNRLIEAVREKRKTL